MEPDRRSDLPKSFRRGPVREVKTAVMNGKLSKWTDAVVKRIGTASLKQRIWDREHASGHWDWRQDPSRPMRERDIAYEALDRHSAGLDILDLGCGDGYTCGAIAGHFREYLGVDISKVAAENAERRLAQDPVRGQKSHFQAGDILSYVPPKLFSIILFSDCLQYFPGYQVKRILRRYSEYLKPDGLLMVRLCDREKYREIILHIKNEYQVLESLTREDSAGVVLTFVPSRNGQGAVC